ncbi:MAG TPA: PAS domain-containing protein [Vicinamibacteria bacterium]|nr:PAS domain-containing protein [Vicinamibacteria bacterium]
MSAATTATARRPAGRLVPAALVVAGVIFVTDLRVAPEVAVPTFYVVVVLFGLWSPRRRLTVALAAGVTLLTVLGAAVAPGGAGPRRDAVNRALAVVAIWATALAVVRHKTAERRLHDERRQGESYLEIAAVAIVALDAEGRVVLVNPRGCELLGRDPHEVLGEPWIERFVPESHRGQARAVFQGLLAGALEPGHSFEHPVVTRGGGERLVVWRSTLRRDATGRVSGTLSSGEDVTARRRAETLLERVLDSAPLALLAIDRSGTLTLAEGKELERMGFPPAALRGETAFDRFRELPWLVEPLRRALAGESAAMAGELGASSHEVHGTPLRDAAGEVVGAVAVSLDVTKRTRAEAALRKREALAQLGEMAAVVAHEVRNPLAGIRATLQVLATRLPAKDQPTVASLYARIDALNAMTESLLLFSRPRAPRPEPLSLPPLLREAAGLLRGDGRWSGVQVEVSGDEVRVQADPLLLRGVFLNLFLNAAQATGGSGTIRASIETAGGSCRVSIADAGPGIPADVLERVFEPFFTTRHRGTGLGLAMVRRQVEAHGGEATIGCPPEGGTIVTLTLPLASAPDR